MDPLSITASIITVLQLTQSLITYANSVRNASKEQERVAVEASNLLSLLTAPRFRVESVKSHDPWFNQVKLLGHTNGPLEQFQQLLEKMVTIISKHSPASTSSTVSVSLVYDQSRAKLAWYFTRKDVQDLLARIERLKTLINLALINDLTALTQEIFCSVNSLARQTEQIQMGITNIQGSINIEDTLKHTLSHWLGLPDPSINHRAALARRQANTGLWLTTGSSYQAWKASVSSSMWLHGKPGCGKTILSATVLENILQSSHDNQDTFASYFFFDFNDREKQSWTKAVRSLLYQLCLQMSNCLQELEKLYIAYNKGNRQPADDDILLLFRSCVAAPGTKYVLIDALDECVERENFLTFLYSIIQRRHAGLHIIMTSRDERDIQERIKPIIDYRIDIQGSAVEADIQAYINERLTNDLQLKKWSPAIRNEVSRELVKKADGMFRWVFCQLESLKTQVKLSSLKRSLQSLPKTLDETYERMISQIRSLGNLDCVVWILQWLCFSARPLSLSEINEIIAMRAGDEQGFWPEERLPDPFDVMKICSALISCIRINNFPRSSSARNRIVADSKTPSEENDLTSDSTDCVQVRLAHYSVKEYLLSGRSLAPFNFKARESHDQIAEGCLGYLHHMSQENSDISKLLTEYPLAEYATQGWLIHGQEVDGELSETVLKAASQFFLDKCSHQSLWQQLYYHKRSYGEKLEHVPPLLLDISELGQVDLLSKLIDEGSVIDARNSLGQTALHIASQCGHERVVKLLLDRGADIATRDKHGNTAVHATLSVMPETIVWQSLNWKNYTMKSNEDDHDDLYNVSERAREKVVQLLIDHGVELEAHGQRGLTALHLATIYCRKKTMHFLLDKGADIEARTDDRHTALHMASENGYEDVVGLLLDRGADVDARIQGDITALHRALRNKQRNIVQLLLDRGASMSARDYAGRTAMFMAVELS